MLIDRAVTTDFYLKEKNIVIAHKNRGELALREIMECGVQKETTFALWMRMT